MTADPRESEVLRLLQRYLVEIVEAYNLCPWAKAARQGGELAVGILWGVPTVDQFVACAEELLARPTTRVAMVVAPEFAGTLAQLRDVRAAVAKRCSSAGVAEFHPGADLDLASPSRLVRFLRRSPDPMLQLVPLAILDGLRSPDRVVIDRIDQMDLASLMKHLPAPDIADRIASANHATIAAVADEVVAKLAAIAADRAASY